MSQGLTESIVEEAVLVWPKSLGWTVEHDREIASGEPAAGRSDLGQVILAQQLQGASM